MLKLQEFKFLLKILFIYLTCEQICQFIIKLASVTLTPLKYRYTLGGFFFYIGCKSENDFQNGNFQALIDNLDVSK